jgi:uncharacterized protein YegP (UPF0339 family)
MKFQIFKDDNGAYRWVLLSKHDKPVVSGGPYKRKAYCVLEIALIQSSSEAEIEDRTVGE